MSRMIESIDRVCEYCGSQMGVIHGIWSDTFYCRNYKCYSIPFSTPNDKGQEILNPPQRLQQRLMSAVRQHWPFKNATDNGDHNV